VPANQPANHLLHLTGPHFSFPWFIASPAARQVSVAFDTLLGRGEK
jgi:hypothetical protein